MVKKQHNWPDGMSYKEWHPIVVRVWQRAKLGLCPFPKDLTIEEIVRYSNASLADLRAGRPPKAKSPPNLVGKDIPCYWCDYTYRLDGKKACPRCGKPFDQEKTLRKLKIDAQTYRERLSTAERRKQRIAAQGANLSATEAGKINRKLNRYLKRKATKR